MLSIHYYLLQEIGISRANYTKIQELQSQRDITILHGGIGGYTRVSVRITNIYQPTKPVNLSILLKLSHEDKLWYTFYNYGCLILKYNALFSYLYTSSKVHCIHVSGMNTHTHLYQLTARLYICQDENGM